MPRAVWNGAVLAGSDDTVVVEGKMPPSRGVRKRTDVALSGRGSDG